MRAYLQGYLAHETTPTPLGPPKDLRHRPTVGLWGGAFSYERGTPVDEAAVPSGSPDELGREMAIPGYPGCTLHAVDRRTLPELDFRRKLPSPPTVWCGPTPHLLCGVVTTVVSGDHIGVVWSPLCGLSRPSEESRPEQYTSNLAP